MLIRHYYRTDTAPWTWWDASTDAGSNGDVSKSSSLERYESGFGAVGTWLSGRVSAARNCEFGGAQSREERWKVQGTSVGAVRFGDPEWLVDVVRIGL